MLGTKVFEKNLRYLIGATKGGPMRARIMVHLLEGPLNPNMLAQRLGVDYKTVVHHLEVLKRNNWVTRGENKYGVQYFPTFTPQERDAFMEVAGLIGKKT